MIKNNKLKSYKNDASDRTKEKIRENYKNCIDEKTKVKIWIRTLLYSYRTFPRIINTIDKIILTRASEFSFSFDIFNNSKSSDNQFNIVIDLSERKKKLLNIYVMTKNLLSSLSEKNYGLAYSKFYEKRTNDELAEEYGVSTRTIFRKINELIESLYCFTLKNRWSLKFIELQVMDEQWLIDKYNQFLDEFVIDTVK